MKANAMNAFHSGHQNTADMAVAKIKFELAFVSA